MPGYSYSDQEVTKRASGGGKDAGRMAAADKLYAQATQPPHDDDARALGSLLSLSGLPGGSGLDPEGKRTEGWATADARNYGKLMLSRIPGSGYTPDYDQAHDGSFNVGHALGNFARIAAPIAGALIPGVGTLGAFGIGALGNAGGNALAGRGFNPIESLGAGAAAGMGNRLLGNGLGAGQSNWGFGSSMPGAPNAPGGIGASPATRGVPGGPAAPGTPGNMTPGMAPGAVSPAATAQAGARGIFGSGITEDMIRKYAPLGIGALGALQAGRQSSQSADLRNQGLDYASSDYNSREPLRRAGLEAALRPQAPREDLSPLFRDPNNPYARAA